MGLFAVREIDKDELFQVYGGAIVPKSQVDTTKEDRYDLGLKEWLMDYVIDGENYAKLPEGFRAAAANHSRSWNASIVWIKHKGGTSGLQIPYLKAKRVIAIYEEITMDYGSRIANDSM